jgi:hypothetical protein
VSSLESHGHNIAKHLLATWFREAAASSRNRGQWECCGVNAIPNRHEPPYGIWVEYPVCNHQLDGTPVWDEENWEREYLKRAGIPPAGAKMVLHDEYDYESFGNGGLVAVNCRSVERPKADRAPTREELLLIGHRPEIILDIACQSKGVIKFGIEVVHKNPVSVEKEQILSKCGFPVIEIPAQWVLAQVGVPDRLVYSRMFGPFGGVFSKCEEWRGRAY